MNPKYTFHKCAQRDLIDHYEFIRIDHPDAAERLLQMVEETLNGLLTMPEMGRLRSSRHPLLIAYRFFPVKNFEKYLIFYRPTNTGITVIRVLHSARDIHQILKL